MFSGFEKLSNIDIDLYYIIQPFVASDISNIFNKIVYLEEKNSRLKFLWFCLDIPIFIFLIFSFVLIGNISEING